MLNDPDFGLNYGKRFRGMPTLLGYLIHSCKTAGEALEKFLRYQRLEHSAWILKSNQDKGLICIDFIPSCSNVMDRLIIDFVFASFLSVQAHITGKALKPKRLQLSYAKPLSVKAHQDIFKCQIDFNCEFNRLTFSAKYLAEPLQNASIAVYTQLEHPLEQSLRLAESGESETARVVRFLSQVKKLNKTSIDSIAAKMKIGVRDMQIKLKTEGTTFRSIRESLLKQTSLDYLSDRTLSIQEICYLLGFSDISGFYRAFSRWTGKTPLQMRSEMESISSSPGTDFNR